MVGHSDVKAAVTDKSSVKLIWFPQNMATVNLLPLGLADAINISIILPLLCIILCFHATGFQAFVYESLLQP